MRRVHLVFGSGATLLLATVLGGCGGGSDSGVSIVSPIGGRGATPSASGGQDGGSGGATTAAGGGVNLTLCSEPPTELAWTDCDNSTVPPSEEYPFAVLTLPEGDGLTSCSTYFYVPVAEEGTVPDVSEICAATTEAVSSGWSTRVTLTVNADGTATGHITLAPSLADATVTQVAVALVEQDAGFGSLTLSEPTQDGDGYTFAVSQNDWVPDELFPRLVFTVTLSLDCNGVTREVVSTTALYRCLEQGWLSSGDACGECSVICEMIASPTLPPETTQAQALAQVVRAQVTRVGQYGSALLMQARHDGGAERFEYQWDVSAGEILWRDKDLMLWMPPSNNAEHLIQVALLGEDAAAVSSCRLRTHSLGKG